MPQRLDPRLDILPAAQREIWSRLSAAPGLGLVLYGGTAIALHLGHRESLDFDFIQSEPLDKDALRASFDFIREAPILQDGLNILVVSAAMPSGGVRVSLFGGIGFGRVKDALQTRDGELIVASLDDLMATKLKAILDRVEAKDYRDIAEMISAGVSLPTGLSAFRKMFGGEPSQVLRAIGFFDDGDLRTLDATDRDILRSARDDVRQLPDVQLKSGLF